MKNPDSLPASSGFEQMSFLPAPEFNPVFPTPNTITARLLSFLLNGQSFTHPEFEAITASWRLSAVVFVLRELGWPIESHDIPAPTPECPNRFISRYFLKPETIKAVLGGAP